jgi:pimeloyl-ACP methyl ester carboxylesterase
MCGTVTRRELSPKRLSAVCVAAIAGAVLLIDALALARPAFALERLAASNARPDAQRKGSQGASPDATPPVAEPSPIQPQGRVYLFRGALGLIFSRGMDKLAGRIERAGITANVYEFTVCGLITSAAIEDYKQSPFPIVLIGHSMGGRCALQFAEKLKDEGIPVSLVVTIDPAHMSPDVPSNVERFINIFLSKDVLGGGDIKPSKDFAGHYASYDMQQHSEVLHINIDKMDLIHQQLVAKIEQIALTPAKTEAEIVPLRMVVPPKTDVELWDSGAIVLAHAGDTLQTFALLYRLPPWALTQANSRLPETAPLGAGQRVVIPRHLMPLMPVAEPVSQKR